MLERSECVLIQCTGALLKELGKRPKDLVSHEVGEQFPNYFFAWHANLIYMNRRKTVVLMNNATRYPIVLYGLRKADFENIEVLINDAIIEAMQLEGIAQSVIDLYIQESGKIQFSKTENRRMTAWLNNTVREVEFIGEYLDKTVTTQGYLSIATSRLLQKFKVDTDYEYPYVKLHENLYRLYETVHRQQLAHVIEVEMYSLHIQIEMGEHDIWRRVLVPATFSFRHLHHIIQTVFDWHHTHLHEFTVLRHHEKHITIVQDDDPEILYYIDTDRFDILDERFTSLKDIFSQNDMLQYMYDFGDSWHHIVSLEKVVVGNELKALFIEGKGERPPEDVGGESGYEHYLHVINSPHHPEYESMVRWATEQKETKQTHEQVNHRLRNVLSPSGFSRYIPRFDNN